MEVYCTRPFTHHQTKPHLTEVEAENLRDMDKKSRDSFRCATCGMSLILNGHYVPIKKIGQGGFGCTFLALDLSFGLDAKRAIKQFRSDHLLLPGQVLLAKKAFEREYRIQDQLKHIQIPRVYEPFDVEAPPFNSTDKNVYYYFVQEYIEGEDLQKKLQNRQQQSNSKFSEVEVLDIFMQLLGVLDYIHSSSPSIIHRDIKPSNIIQASNGTCYLIDFGAVKQVLPVVDSWKQTTIMGTPGYAPPEQFDGVVDFSSDLYALAKTCICLLTSSPSSSVPQGLKAPFTEVLAKMVDPEPQMRYRSILEIRHSLNLRFRPPKWLTTATIGIITIAIAITLNILLHPSPSRPVEFTPKIYKEIKNVVLIPSGIYYYGGSTTWTPLIKRLDGAMGENIRKVFTIKQKNEPDELISTESGLKMLEKNEIEIALSSKSTEVSDFSNSTFRRTMIARSTTVMVVNKDSKLKAIQGSEIDEIRDGKIDDWNDIKKDIRGGKSARIVFYATAERYAGDRNKVISISGPKQFIKVESAQDGMKKVARDPNGAMIVPIQIAVAECDVKILHLKLADSTTINPYSSGCSKDSRQAKVNINFIKTREDRDILDLEVVFKNDREKSKKAGEYLATILLTDEGQRLIKEAGYLPISSSK